MKTLSFQHTLTCLLARWKSRNIGYNAGATTEQLCRVKQTTHFAFDADFLLYLGQVNGFADFDWDEGQFSFWSTTRISQEAASQPTALVCFADYSINLGSFGYCRTRKDTRIYLRYQTGSQQWVVAESFHDFLQRYLQAPETLLR